MKRLNLTLAMIGIISYAFSQSTLIWSEDFETYMPNYSSNAPALQVENDIITVTGRKNSAEGQRLLLVRYNLLGDTLLTITYGSNSLDSNTIIAYKSDENGNLYLLHRVSLEYYKSKIVIQKFAGDGSLSWEQQLYSLADTSFSPVSLGLINDTCIFVSAYKEWNYPLPGDDVANTIGLPYIYAFHSNGTMLFERAFNTDTEIDHFSYEIIPYNNTAILFGYNYATNFCLISVDLNNSMTLFSGIEVEHGFNKVQITADSNLIITAILSYRITKLDFNGNLIWSSYYGTNLPGNIFGDEMEAITQDSEGNIYVTGRHYGDGYGTATYSNADILTIKYDTNGNMIWQNRYEFGINNADLGNFITLRNGYVYVGGQSQRLGVSTDYDYLILKIDLATGIGAGLYKYNGVDNGNDALSSLFVFEDGSIALTGLSAINLSYHWTTQLLSDINLPVQNINSENILEVYPNPVISGDLLTVEGADFKEYSIISSIGQIVQNGKLGANESQVITLENVTAGMYLLYLKTDEGVWTRKIIVK